jgi:Tol biopolymer transport system component
MTRSRSAIIATTTFILLLSAFALFAWASPVQAAVMERLSLTSGGGEGAGPSQAPAVNQDGRYVAFESSAPNLVPGDGNGTWDVFVRDRMTGTTSLVSVSFFGPVSGAGPSRNPAISADGRYVAFESQAPDLVLMDMNGPMSDIFVRDLLTGTTSMVSVGLGGGPAVGPSYFPAINGDGRFIAFSSDAPNLVPVDPNGVIRDIFVRDRMLAMTTMASVSTGGAPGNAASDNPSINVDGRYVAFWSQATTLVPPDPNGPLPDIFVRDQVMATTKMASVGPGGVQAAGPSLYPSISGDGRYVAFESCAPNLVPMDANGPMSDVFLFDQVLVATRMVSVGLGGGPANGPSFDPSVNLDGRFIAFESQASNLVPGDPNGACDVFLADMLPPGLTLMVSVGLGGMPAAGASYNPSVDLRGQYVAFGSAPVCQLRQSCAGPECRRHLGHHLRHRLLWGERCRRRALRRHQRDRVYSRLAGPDQRYSAGPHRRARPGAGDRHRGCERRYCG